MVLGMDWSLTYKTLLRSTVGGHSNGLPPEASLYAAIIREISAKKGEARFKKVDRGLFTANLTKKGG